MKRFFFILIFSVLSVASAQAQFAKPLKSRNLACHNKSPFSIGITGSFAANDMMYSAVSKAKLSPYLAPTVGLAFEWNTMNIVSVGLDASYAMRGTNEVFATEFLTSYTTTTFSRVHYTLVMNGVEIRVPVTLYLSDDETIQPYFYVAPRFNLWLNGSLHWERTYDDESYAPLVYENEVNNATMVPYEFGAVAGLGLCSRILIQRTQFFLKFDLSYGINVLNDFSQHEVNEDVAFHGWGDIEHETLGQRRLQDLEARLTLLIPFGKHLKDACAFDQKMKKGK
jgi:hypothetical protein